MSNDNLARLKELTKQITRPLQVLVVDDYEPFALAMLAMLEAYPCQAEAVYSTGQAIEKIKGMLYDLIFLDVKMIDNGSTVLEMLTRWSPKTAVVLVTGLEPHEAELLVKLKPATILLTKPVSSTTLSMFFCLFLKARSHG